MQHIQIIFILSTQVRMKFRKSQKNALLDFLSKGGADLKGEIKRLIREREFGFIIAEDGKEVFFHRSALEGIDFDALDEGNSVEFEVEKGPKGLRAAHVKMIETHIIC
jgi:CspA family cold shock protein